MAARKKPFCVNSSHRLNYQVPPFIRSSSIAVLWAHTGSLHPLWTKIPIWSKANTSWEKPYTKYKLVSSCVDHAVSLESSSGRTRHEEEEECIGNGSVWLCLVRVCEWEGSPSEEANRGTSAATLQAWCSASCGCNNLNTAQHFPPNAVTAFSLLTRMTVELAWWCFLGMRISTSNLQIQFNRDSFNIQYKLEFGSLRPGPCIEEWRGRCLRRRGSLKSTEGPLPCLCPFFLALAY